MNNKRITPICDYCSWGKILDSGHILCKYNGVMESGDRCKKFVYDAIKRIPPAPPKLPEFNDDDFKID